MSQAVGQFFGIGIHGLPRPFLFGWISFRLGKSDRAGATLGVGLGVGNPKENRPDNQQVKCWVCWVLPTACQCMGAGVRVVAF